MPGHQLRDEGGFFEKQTQQTPHYEMSRDRATRQSLNRNLSSICSIALPLIAHSDYRHLRAQ